MNDGGRNGGIIVLQGSPREAYTQTQPRIIVNPVGERIRYTDGVSVDVGFYESDDGFVVHTDEEERKLTFFFQAVFGHSNSSDAMDIWRRSFGLPAIHQSSFYGDASPALLDTNLHQNNPR